MLFRSAAVMADEFMAKGYRVISGGTDNHLLVVDMTSKDIAGKDCEAALEEVGISVSRSTIPNDPNPPMNPSGVRFGTPAATTRGMREEEMKQLVGLVDQAIVNREKREILAEIKIQVAELCRKFPVPGQKVD